MILAVETWIAPSGRDVLCFFDSLRTNLIVQGLQ